MIQTSLKVYSIQVQGIRCTNCAAKIKKSLISLDQAIKKVSVNVIQQKVFVTLQGENLLDKIKYNLQTINFRQIAEPVLIANSSDFNRTLNLIYQNIDKETEIRILETIKNMTGFIDVISKQISTIQQHQLSNQKTVKQSYIQTKISVIYNPLILKARQIIDCIELINPNFKIWNERIAGLKNQIKVDINVCQLVQSIFLSVYFFVFNMILPETGEWYHKIMCFPHEMGIFSCLLLLNIILTIFTLYRHGRIFLYNAYKNLRDYQEMNMETLVALGSVSSFLLFLFFLIKNSVNFFKIGNSHDSMQPIMEMSDSLSSSTLIIIIVTIGKYLQKKVKKKIQKTTESIFPQSQLFHNLSIHYIQIKNRNLIIEKEKIYDVSCIQKNDFIKPQPGRLLLDIVIISGKIKAVQSIMTGSQQIRIYQQGQRLRAGAVIIQCEGLVQVQNVFQKSTLIQIGSQINMAQNTEESNEIGIQSICKQISNYFVKIILILSIITFIVWGFLIGLKVVIEKCEVCYIVQRGVGVLVASCPCALGLAVPTVIAIAMNLALKSGILFRKNNIFQKSKKCNIVAFDKTGTLFTRVEKINEYKIISKNYEEKSLWQLVAIVEKQFKHPLAELLYKESIIRSKIIGNNFNYVLLDSPILQKQGIVVKLRQKKTNSTLDIKIGNKKLFKKYDIVVQQVQANTDAATIIYLSINKQVSLAICLNTHSNLRPQAKAVIQQLYSLGKQVHILSGDSKESVKYLGQILQIPQNRLHPEYSAHMKMQWIKNLQNNPQCGVMMIGDGLNDIPCLQQACIGVSINAKSQLNLNAADVIILSQNLHKIVTIFKLLNRSTQFIYANLFWAFIYNLAILPIVSGMFYTLHVTISPVWSSLAMSLSSIIVVLFSQLMLCFSYDKSLIQQLDRHQNLEIVKQDNVGGKQCMLEQI